MLRRAALLLFVLSAACSSEPASPAEGSAPAAADGSRAPATGSQGSADGSRPSADAGSEPHAPAKTQAGPLFRAAADDGALADFARDEASLESDGTVVIAAGKGHPGTDPQPSGYHGGSFYNGGTYRYAIVTSPVWTAAAAFDRVTPSFEVTTPPGTWVHVKVAARVNGAWTKDYSLGVWAYDESTVRRHSVTGQGDVAGDVATDTLELNDAADALRVTVVLFSASAVETPRLRAVSAIAVKDGAPAAPLANDTTVWGTKLPVPKRSQMIYPGGGEVWCSPTSTSMLLAFWGIQETPPEAAKRCHDVVYGGTGNWPFNTAHAAGIEGGKLHGFVTRLGSFAQVERLVGAGVPVAISVAYGAGQLGGSPIPSTAGHLIVVKGFAEDGDVVVNDPAFGSDATVETTYDRTQLTTAWKRSGGTTYVVWPATKKLPTDPLGAF